MTKIKQFGLNVRESKAAALDALFKQESNRTRDADLEKTARLKALRMARDAESSAAPTTTAVRAAKRG